MAETEKIFRDPLFNYVTIDRNRDKWLLDLIDTREVQRLRRIHQLGVSHFTYPGADHSRFSHTLGVVHLMQHACQRIETLGRTPVIERARSRLLAAALLHDVGHGPFSHLSESALGIKHEEWSCRIIESEETEVYQKLTHPDVAIPVEEVVSLIQEKNHDREPWEKTLLSSELDVDRLDYLRRDSYFTGAGYGHYDWYRILSSFSFGEKDGRKILVWPDKAKYAIEEYIFSRFYMYHNVYQHKTTRGFEKLLHSVWKYAKQMHENGGDACFVKEISEFLHAEEPTVKQYLALEDATLIYQLQVWARHSDKVLSELAGWFLARNCLAVIQDPVSESWSDGERDKWEKALQDVVAAQGFKPPEFYALRDDLKFTVYKPYMKLESEEELQDPYNAIFIQSNNDGPPQEISTQLERLAAVTGARDERYRYYVPRECRDKACLLATSRKW